MGVRYVKPFRSDYTYDDLYKMYKEYVKNEYKDKANKVMVSREIFGKLISDFNKKVTEKILDGDLVSMPCGLGMLGVFCYEKKLKMLKDNKDKTNINTFPVDWKSTKELWEKDEKAKKNKKLIRFINDNDGYRFYVVKWRKHPMRVYFKALRNYKFIFSREAKRELVRRIKSGEVEYIKT